VPSVSEPAASGPAAGDDAPRPAAAPGSDADADPAPRGPFEPLWHVDHPLADADADAVTRAHRVDWLGTPDEPQASAGEPDVLDFGPDDPGDGALERLRNLYATAEMIAPARFDSHFAELLERQRKLIREYLSESSPAKSGLDAQPVIGFDSADSLSDLRGSW
jgi:hypothetical protein